MLRWRLILAVVILAPLIGLLYVDYHWSGSAPGIWLIPIGLIVTCLAAGEVLDFLSAEDHRPSGLSVYAGAVLIYGASCAPLAWPAMGSVYPPDCPLGKLGWPLCATAAAVVMALVVEMYRFQRPGGHLVRAALAVLVIGYTGLLLCFLPLLRQFRTNEWGMAALVSVIFVAKISDTAAYAFGKLMGRNKMSPLLSPGKTMEGAIGGTLAAGLAAWCFFQYFVPWIVPDAPATPWWRGVLFGMLIAGSGMLGDLCESLIKRDLRRKDSSGWLPGLGGVLDVVDSIIVAAPVAFLCWAAALVGPG